MNTFEDLIKMHSSLQTNKLDRKKRPVIFYQKVISWSDLIKMFIEASWGHGLYYCFFFYWAEESSLNNKNKIKILTDRYFLTGSVLRPNSQGRYWRTLIPTAFKQELGPRQYSGATVCVGLFYR